MVFNVLSRAALLGAAAGARSVTPLAALAQQSDKGWAKAITAVAAAGEIVADKLPGTPSRLRPGPLGARIVTGALAGGLDAQRRGRSVVLPAIVAGAASAAASYGGAFWRAYAAGHGFGTPAALAEDAAAIVLATLAAAD